ncbi:MAG: nitroreductase family protein [Verrucomicrobia bacterium]|nr:nitroreductase family protein [Verrucomicrobiota bacterium]
MIDLTEAWNIHADDFPLNAPAERQLKFLLRYAVLAPSGHNTQPWLFRVKDGTVELFADRTRALAVLDPDDRELVISCGGALLNLRVAMRHFGYEPEIAVLPDANDPDLLARVRLGERRVTVQEDKPLFGAIRRRHTNRAPFEDKPVPNALLRTLRKEALNENAWFHVVEDEENRLKLAALVAEADCLQWAQKNFRREIAAWVHPNRSASHDGVPGSAKGFNDFTSLAGPLVIRTIDAGSGRAARDKDIALASPVLAMIGTDTDNPASWLAAGQAMERVLLRACTENVSASFLNQPAEIPELRARLTDIVGRTGFPHVILRMGYGPQTAKPTPRRLVDEILLKD